MVAQTEPGGLEPQIYIPLEPRLPPVGVPILRLLGTTEVLDLHLLEFARAKGEVARIDLVPKALANLSDSKRKLDAPRVDDVLEIGENPLRRLGAEIGDVRFAFESPDERLEHQVKR